MSCTNSNGYKRKRGQASRSTAKSHGKAQAYQDKMDFDNESEGVSSKLDPVVDTR
jgi:hypothetical protein